MAGNTVVVSVLGQTSGLKAAFGEAESTLSKFGKVAGAVAVAVGVAAAAIGTKAVKSASELQQNMGALESVFKDSAGTMEQWANKAASTVGLAKSEYAGLATVLGAQLKNMGVSQEQLAGQTDGLIRKGADLAAMFGGTTSDAVSALSALLRGERDPIERYGVSINDAAVKAKMAEMGLSGLSGEAEKNANLQATLALLNQQTADSMGQFSREADTLAGAQQRLSAGTENLYATLGTALLPAVTAVTSAIGSMVNAIAESAWFAAFTQNLTSASTAFADFVYGLLNGTGSIDFSGLLAGLLPAVISGIQAAAGWIAGGGMLTIVTAMNEGRSALLSAALQVFGAIVEALPQIIPALVTAALTMVQGLIAFIASSAPAILAAAVQAFQMLVQAIITVLPSILTTLVTMLPQLVTTILGMIPALLQVAVQLFTTLVEALPVIIPLLITAVIELLPKLVESILGMIPGILDAAINLFMALVESLPVILPLLLQAVLDLLPVLVSTVVSMIPRLIQAAVQLFTGLVQAIPKIVPQLISSLISLAPQMVSTLIGLVPQLVQAGVDLIGGLVQGLFSAAGSVGSALLDIAKNAVGDFLSFLGIHSPSRLFKGFGKNTVQGLVLGLTQNADMVDGAMSKLSTRVADGFDPSLTSPDMSFAGSGAGAAGGGNTYNVTVNGGISSPAETGRAVVEAIRAYESVGGRL